MISIRIATLTAALGAAAAPVFAQENAPQWIWSAKQAKPNETAFFRTEFTLEKPPEKAVLRASCDNGAVVVINGQQAAKNRDWSEPTVVRVEKHLKPGPNWIAVRATNDTSGAAGLILEILDGTGKDAKRIIATSGQWKYDAQGQGWNAAGTDTAQWKTPAVLGAYGVQPWGRVFDGAAPGGGGGGAATGADALQVAPGFKAELLYTVPKADQGSWVSLTYDDKNRLIAGDQDGHLYRLTLAKGQDVRVEELATKVGHAQGLLYTHGALYVVVNGPGSGLYRLRDTNGDDQFDEETLLRSIDGGGEHGPHQVVLAPDGQSLYVLGGNHTKIPNPEKSLVPRLWQEDHLTPRMWDAGGHAVGIMAPGGWICRTDFAGKEWTLVTCGFRNSYDLAFNSAGEAFTYDSDMEWDIGAPWYRPTRICQCVPGGEFGWRSGSGKWPTYYLDSLPPTVDIGPGSPTGVVSGKGAKFPAKYQNAIFALDWTYGTLYAIHLRQEGGAYVGEKEVFVAGKPLPLTDAVILPADGAMYFTIGGRKTQSALYRVTYTGAESTAAAAPEKLNADFVLRRELEGLYASGPDKKVLDKAWPCLGHRDRWVRFAARTAIEHQPVASWQDRALEEHESVNSQLTALCALSRAGDKSLQPKILQSLLRLNGVSMRESEALDMIRVYALCLTRMGKPADPEMMDRLRTVFEPMYPSPSNFINRELCEMLVFLDSKQVVGKTVTLMATAKDDTHQDAPGAELLRLNENYARAFQSVAESRPNRQQIAYAFRLRNATEGWTPDLRRQYFRWFNTSFKWQGGHSFTGFLKNTRTEALGKVPSDMKAQLEGISGELLSAKKDLPRPKGPGQLYTVDGLTKSVQEKLAGRDFDNGLKMFHAALCATCHRFAGEGGGVGPDLTGVGSRYSIKDLLENIIEPSKVISDQYESTLIEKNDGSSVVGRIVSADAQKLKVVSNALDPDTITEVAVPDIKARSRFPLSSMPPALLNSMNEAEALDLIAFLLSGGDANNKAFKK